MTATPAWLADLADRIATAESISLTRGIGCWRHRLNVKDRALLKQVMLRGIHEIFDKADRDPAAAKRRA
jgi:hypothetical protein